MKLFLFFISIAVQNSVANAQTCSDANGGSVGFAFLVVSSRCSV